MGQIRIGKETHRVLKTQAVLEGKVIGEIVAQAVAEKYGPVAGYGPPRTPIQMSGSDPLQLYGQIDLFPSKDVDDGN